MDWDTRLIWLCWMALIGGVCSVVALLFVQGETLGFYIIPIIYGTILVAAVITKGALRPGGEESVPAIFRKIALGTVTILPIVMYAVFVVASYAPTRFMALLYGTVWGLFLGVIVAAVVAWNEYRPQILIPIALSCGLSVALAAPLIDPSLGIANIWLVAAVVWLGWGVIAGRVLAQVLHTSYRSPARGIQ